MWVHESPALLHSVDGRFTIREVRGQWLPRDEREGCLGWLMGLDEAKEWCEGRLVGPDFVVGG